ncbi:hypothetical protein MRX96_034715 [Rhipicephalus microplus]
MEALVADMRSDSAAGIYVTFPILLAQNKCIGRVASAGTKLEYVLGYSGYFTVNSEFNSNLFFWFVPAMERPEQAPVLAWLQGGPGSSSLLGFFAEHGPYGLEDGDPPVPVRRPITWCQYFSIIYVDEPVGAGYSFTESEQGYARNLTDLARDMVEFLQQFFTLFPEFGARDFYVTGESFGGKFVPATAYALHQAGDSLRVKINLKGIAFGNGITDPPSMIDYGPPPVLPGSRGSEAGRLLRPTERRRPGPHGERPLRRGHLSYERPHLQSTQ